MATPPNSFVSDIKYISPGSSELDDYEDIHHKVYDSFIKNECELYFMNYKDLEATLHKDFDVIKVINEHPTVSVQFSSGEIIEIDELLVPLITIINREEILTTQSCQYNRSGYCSISFSLYGFQKWCNLLLDKALNKYGEDSYYDCKILERFTSTDIERRLNVKKIKDRTLDNIILFTSGIYNGVKEFTFGIVWMFLQDDLDSILKDIKELLE